MSGNKVKFHPQERLDLVDINAMQDLLHAGMDEEIGAFLVAGGLLWLNGSVTYSHLNRYLFPADFVFAALIKDTSVTGLKRLRVGKYDSAAVSNDPINIYAYQFAAQAYYAANGQMPSVTPQDAAYNASTFGSLYPVVYARVTYQEDTQDTRRFWDVAQATEVSNVVNTRATQVVKFLVVQDGVTPASPAGVSTGLSTEWVKLFQVSGWAYSTSLSAVIPNSYRYFTYADNVLKLDDSSNALLSETWATSLRSTHGGGLPYVSAVLLELAKFHRTSGLNDASVPASYRVDTQLSEAPRLSLDGLAGMTEALRSSTIKVKTSCTIHLVQTATNVDNERDITGTISWKYATDKLTYLSSVADPGRKGWLKPSNIAFDFGTFRRRYPNDLERLNGATWTNYADAIIKQEVFRELIVQVPEEYLGWTLDVNVTPVAHHNEAQANVFSGLLQAGLSTINLNEPLRVEALTLTAANGSASTVHGFRIRWGYSISDGEYDFRVNQGISFNSNYLLTGAAGTYLYGLNIDATLHNPNGIEA